MIKRLTITDYEEIVNLWQVAGLAIREKGRDHPDKLQEQLQSDKVVILGKIIDERIVGIVLISHDNRKGWINRLAVHPMNRQKGIGRELLSTAEDLLKKKGIEIFGALILSDNLESIRLFENSDYIKLEHVNYFSKRMREDS
ncbi:MAG: GNAT family N-acetyltransferase [Candidatus Hodarchaeales archaeon]